MIRAQEEDAAAPRRPRKMIIPQSPSDIFIMQEKAKEPESTTFRPQGFIRQDIENWPEKRVKLDENEIEKRLEKRL